MTEKKKINVVAGIIQVGSETLCLQRPKHKHEYISEKYEFPGGKIEKGETKEEALKRELQEELKLDAEIGKLFCTINHEYPDFHLTLHCFICKQKTKQITLTEHIDAKWLTSEQLKTLDWIKADIPIIDKLIENAKV